MQKSGRELSGRSLHRFLTRFFLAQRDISPETAERLADVSALTFTAVYLRHSGSAALTKELRERSNKANNTAHLPTASNKGNKSYNRKEAQTAPKTQRAKIKAGTSAKFDPYKFGLVPVFVREGPDGLMQRLNTIDRLEHLRRIARAQQIALPVEFRRGESPLEDVRSAIVAAVRKRIADRRAAAG